MHLFWVIPSCAFAWFPNKKKEKRILNNNLAILPSHDSLKILPLWPVLFTLVIPFPYHWSLLLLRLLWINHMHHLLTPPLLLFQLYIWTLLLVVSYSLTSKALYSLFFHFLSPHTYCFSYSTLHYSICYYLKFILGSQFLLYFLLSVPTVMDQVPEPFTLPIYSFFPSLYLCS